ncbi:hypothetical protein J6590_029624 [Homalodisca vitripennis]|nr:hypothetical protein J6590_029624 [Homalodisca vitripennis]
MKAAAAFKPQSVRNDRDITKTSRENTTPKRTHVKKPERVGRGETDRAPSHYPIMEKPHRIRWLLRRPPLSPPIPGLSRANLSSGGAILDSRPDLNPRAPTTSCGRHRHLGTINHPRCLIARWRASPCPPIGRSRSSTLINCHLFFKDLIMSGLEPGAECARHEPLSERSLRLIRSIR